VLTLGDLNIKTPSGRSITITPEEEDSYVRDAVKDRIKEDFLWKTNVTKAAVHAIGTAAGFAVGGYLVGFLLGRKAKS